MVPEVKAIPRLVSQQKQKKIVKGSRDSTMVKPTLLKNHSMRPAVQILVNLGFIKEISNNTCLQ